MYKVVRTIKILPLQVFVFKFRWKYSTYFF